MPFENSSGRVLERIMAFSHSGKPVKDLSRIKMLLAAAGDPQDKLRFIHIAGTNGKGSTAEMLSEIMQAAGERTGLFTSPFILEYADRMRVNGRNIPTGDLERLAERVLGIAEELPCRGELSQFEITQTIAFLWFLEQECSVVVLETGLGGALDCTNAVETAVLCLITSVSFDHTAILGDTLTEIAEQKLGICRPGVPCIMSGYGPEEIRSAAERYRAEHGIDLTLTDPGDTEILETGLTGVRARYKGLEYHVPMGGAHQAANAAAVIEGCRRLGIPDETIRAGLAKASVPARAQLICREPVIILDGAHNPDAMRVLTDHINLNRLPGQKCVAAVGMCRDKDMRTTLQYLARTADEILTLDGFSDRAEDRNALAALIRELWGNARAFSGDTEELIRELRRNTGGIGVICGSLYLAAGVLETAADK